MSRVFFFSSIFFFIFACSTHSMSGSYVQRDRVNHSVEAIIKSFERATLGIRGRSPNGRELVSKYQSVKGDKYENAYKKKERAYARLAILGDRRPYTLKVQLVIEERTEYGTYEVVDEDDDAAQAILDKMVEFLVNRPDKDDFIDDYRAF